MVHRCCTYLLILAIGAHGFVVRGPGRVPGSFPPLRSTETEEPLAALGKVDDIDTALAFLPKKYWFGRIDVNLGPALKPVSEILPPSWPDDKSALAQVNVQLPIGMVLAESDKFDGRVEVIEVLPGSNAEGAGVLPGDVLRGVTAMAFNRVKAIQDMDRGNLVEASTRTTSERALFICDKQQFESVMRALGSNDAASGGPGFATLVMERDLS